MPIVDGLCTLAEARESLNWKSTDTANDADLEKYIEAATPLIEEHTGPIIVRSRIFTVDGGSAVIVLPVRFNTVTTVVEDGVTVTDFVADPKAGLIYGGTTTSSRSFSSGTQNVVVTVAVGSATIPPNVVLAARELVRHLWQLGRQGSRPSFDNDPIAVVPQHFSMPNRVLEALSPNRSVGGFA